MPGPRGAPGATGFKGFRGTHTHICLSNRCFRRLLDTLRYVFIPLFVSLDFFQQEINFCFSLTCDSLTSCHFLHLLGDPGDCECQGGGTSGLAGLPGAPGVNGSPGYPGQKGEQGDTGAPGFSGGPGGNVSRFSCCKLT